MASCREPGSDKDVALNSLFTLLDSSQTGIHFRNDLAEGPNTNILMYEYFYNGGGVAAGDFNQDGWIDLYFTANMGENKLFLNQGGWKFKDVTTAANLGGLTGPWKTGVTAVDINGDQRLDLYICYSGALPPEKRRNQLWINQGNDSQGIPQFREEASRYGLASAAFSNQAYFFDFDRDQDLDMLLLNHNPRSLPVLNEVGTAKMMAEDDTLQGLRLFRQDQNVFVDITATTGIRGTGLAYGLGVAISDFDNDGWPDFYVCNDYTVPDYLYMNNRNGTFTDRLQEALGHNSHFSMGNDAGDINNDGWSDLFTLDMLPEGNRRQKLLMAPDNYAKFELNLRSGFYYQYMRNMLQLNNGNGTFSEIGQLAGISNTDWSWSALFTDFDNDGWKDLYVTNGYLRDYTNLDFINYMDQMVKRKGRLQREDVLEIIKHMPSSDVTNYMFSNQGDLTFNNSTVNWGLSTPSNSNGAAYADLDNDGDQDLVVNNINRQAFLFRNNSSGRDSSNYLQITLGGSGGNTLGLGARISLYYQEKTQMAEQFLARGYLSSVSPVIHFGLGKVTMVDTVLVQWPDGLTTLLTNVATNQRLIIKQQNTANPILSQKMPENLFTPVATLLTHLDRQPSIHDFNRQPLLTIGYSDQGPYQAQLEADGDGLTDLIIGGAAGQPATLFLQKKGGRWTKKNVPVFEEDAAYTDTKLLVLDVNKDGHDDVYVASGGYGLLAPEDSLLQDRLYLGLGQGRFRRSDGLPKMRTSTGAVSSLDINADGYPDLVIGGRVIPGQYPQTPQSYLLMNDGQGKFLDVTDQWAPGLNQMGMVTDILPVDLNSDQKLDLLVVGEWMPVSAWVFDGEKFSDKTVDIFGQSYSGWWNCVRSHDFNGDGRLDFVLGNWGLNSQCQASVEEPAELFYADFDQNGSVDPFLSFYIQGKSYPYLTRDDLVRQLTMFQTRFTDYASYADITLKDLFSADQLVAASSLQVNRLETSYLQSTTTGTYTLKPLPLEAQVSPVHTITVLDANADGMDDLLLCGNNRNVKLRLGKMDANYGVLLLGNGQGDFSYVSQAVSGLNLKGDVRSVEVMNHHLIIGINNAQVQVYRWAK